MKKIIILLSLTLVSQFSSAQMQDKNSCLAEISPTRCATDDEIDRYILVSTTCDNTLVFKSLSNSDQFTSVRISSENVIDNRNGQSTKAAASLYFLTFGIGSELKLGVDTRVTHHKSVSEQKEKIKDALKALSEDKVELCEDFKDKSTEIVNLNSATYE